MKRLIQTTLAAFLVLGLFSTTFGQDATNTINASADVLTTMELTNSTALDFGNISSGSGANVSTGSGGSLDLTAADGSNVSVTIDWSLTSNSNPGLTDGSNDLPVNFTYATDPDETTSSPSNNTGDSDTDGNTTNINFSSFDGGANNVVGIFVGGSISSSDTGTPGTYTGTINVSATYN